MIGLRINLFLMAGNKGNFFYKRLGDKICLRRNQNKLSQHQLGIISDIDRTYINRIEQGQANPTIKTLGKIARALRISLSRLLEGV